MSVGQDWFEACIFSDQHGSIQAFYFFLFISSPSSLRISSTSSFMIHSLLLQVAFAIHYIFHSFYPFTPSAFIIHSLYLSCIHFIFDPFVYFIFHESIYCYVFTSFSKLHLQLVYTWSCMSHLFIFMIHSFALFFDPCIYFIRSFKSSYICPSFPSYCIRHSFSPCCICHSLHISWSNRFAFTQFTSSWIFDSFPFSCIIYFVLPGHCLFY